MAAIPCCLLLPSDQFRAYLRVFTFPEEDACPALRQALPHPRSGARRPRPHRRRSAPARRPPQRQPRRPPGDGRRGVRGRGQRRAAHLGGPRGWPAHCACGDAFREHDHRQFYYERLYTRADTGERFVLAEAPVGAMWYDDRWGLEPALGWLGPDGRCLVVKTPGGTCYLDREVDGKKLHARDGCAAPGQRRPGPHRRPLAGLAARRRARGRAVGAQAPAGARAPRRAYAGGAPGARPAPDVPIL